MSIEIHCPQCGKLVRAPDNAGGRHGKCPYCEEKMYIPMPPESEEEEIRIAPLDEKEARHEEELRREMVRYSATLDREKDIGPAGAESTTRPANNHTPSAAPGEVINVAENVERFLVAMRDSKLEVADQVANRLKRAGARARDYVEGLILDPAPPAISNLPKPLMQGFLKSLLERIG